MDNAISTTPKSIEEIKVKQHLVGKVVKTTLAGAIVDIGLDIPGVIHISQLQKEPVKRVDDVVQAGQEVEVWVRRVFPKKKRIELTMIQPLDLEWREIEKDMVVKGKVTRLEKFGVFVDIGAERPGLVHISELTHDYIRTPGEFVKEGDEVEVKVLDVDRKKKQIRLSMKALEVRPDKVAKVIQTKIDKKDKEKESAPPAEAEKEKPVPTAMEMALRQAMERVKDTESEAPVQPKKRKAGGSSNQLEDILERTLKQKVSK